MHDTTKVVFMGNLMAYMLILEKHDKNNEHITQHKLKAWHKNLKNKRKGKNGRL